MRDDFAALILTHGRPDSVFTIDTLRSHGYTGRIVLVTDDEDKSLPEYRARFSQAADAGITLVTFRKAAVDADTCMPSSNPDRRKCVLFARTKMFDLARELGLRYFITFDDDYTEFSFRFSSAHTFKWSHITDLDAVLDAMVEFVASTPTVSLALSQNGDWIGGAASTHASCITLWRKVMNSFICAVDRPILWRGLSNEDVTAYIENGSRGDLFFTTNFVSLAQIQTQAQAGGMSAQYQSSGTYVKSFQTVMVAPSCVSISTMGEAEKRIHHRIEWKRAVPMIVRASLSKAVTQ